jgi:hypothetical protein
MKFVLPLSALFLSTLWANLAEACSCAPPSLSRSFENASDVWIGTVPSCW